MRVEPYLYFEGRCEEAANYYRDVAGAEIVQLTRFRDSPGVPHPRGAEDKILHASLRFGTTTVSASDGKCSGDPAFQGFSLSVAAGNDAASEALFAALASDGTVQVPLAPTPFASRLGLLVDRFGVHWIITSLK